mmetsp:Transcript_30156/g.76238  ORF Transcript_30156/g.76238 Transcript_30156/m.76238 type:complete len:219 (+) Transcript_30156:1025-1681(+)
MLQQLRRCGPILCRLQCPSNKVTAELAAISPRLFLTRALQEPGGAQIPGVGADVQLRGDPGEQCVRHRTHAVDVEATTGDLPIPRPQLGCLVRARVLQRLLAAWVQHRGQAEVAHQRSGVRHPGGEHDTVRSEVLMEDPQGMAMCHGSQHVAHVGGNGPLLQPMVLIQPIHPIRDVAAHVPVRNDVVVLFVLEHIANGAEVWMLQALQLLQPRAERLA